MSEWTKESEAVVRNGIKALRTTRDHAVLFSHALEIANCFAEDMLTEINRLTAELAAYKKEGKR